MTEDAGTAGLRILITGGAGFLGTLLTRRILEGGPLAVGGAQGREVESITLVDLATPPADIAQDPRVTFLTGGLEDLAERLPDADLIFHLAGVVSGAAEAEFDLGMKTNIDGSRALLEYARKLPVPPVLVFASSLAVFGVDPAIGPVGAVDDSTLPRPQTSYGIQKFIVEQLVADYSRKGFLRGRSVRLMAVTVRPGVPNAAASSFMSGIIREPLAGVRAVCPVQPDLPIALSSSRRTIQGILRAAEVADEVWGSRTAINLPALTTTPREMAAALDAVAGSSVSDLIDWIPDPAIEPLVESWPAVVVAARAKGLGLEPEESFSDIVRSYVEEFERSFL